MAATKSRPWGNTQPPVGASVNWGDPINRDLVGCWLMNEGGGTIVSDLASAKKGTLTGGPPWTVGKFGKSLSFDGTDDYLNTNQAYQFGTGGITISLWMNTTTTAQKLICGTVSDGTTDLIGIQTNSNADGSANSGRTLWNLRADSGNVCRVSFTNVVDDGKLHHLVTMRHGATSSVYVDGVACTLTEAEANNLTENDTLNTQYNFIFGAWNVRGVIGEFFPGIIDNVRIYSRALIAREVSRLYTEPFAGITEPRIRIRSSPAGAPPAGIVPRIMHHRRQLGVS